MAECAQRRSVEQDPAAVPGRRLRLPAHCEAARSGASRPLSLPPLPRGGGREQGLELLEAATETIALWSGEIDFAELADDIAIEARLALHLTDEIKELKERIAALFAQADPQGIFVSAPGVGTILGAQLLGRLGDPNRFRSLAGVRSFSGLVPSLDASGIAGQHGGPTKRGDACLREAIFMAADHARRSDPTLAARYRRLMVIAGKHHNSAICHIATALLTRVVACWRRGERYVIRDLDGRLITAAEGREIVAERYPIPGELRQGRRSEYGASSLATDEPAKPGVAKRSVDRPVQR